MLVLVYRKCSTCLKALKWLEENHVDFVKRPLVVGDDFVLTGFREKEWEEKLLG